MIIGVLDCETTGLCQSDTVTEFAIAVFDTVSKQVIACSSFMIPTPVISAEIESITSISSVISNLISTYTLDSLPLVDHCDAVVAHNASFDKSFLPQVSKPWICSLKDLQWPVQAGKLTHMCADLGVPIAGAHRAIFDVLMLCQCLAKLPDLEEQIHTILTVQPETYVANVSFEKRQLAKDAGFAWFPETKQWRRSVRLSDEATLEWISSLPFGVRKCQ